MEKLFNLPNDQDQSKIVGALLTTAVTTLIAKGDSLEDSLKAVQTIYHGVLGIQTPEENMNTWRNLSPKD